MALDKRHRVTYRDQTGEVCYQRIQRDRAAADPNIGLLFPAPDPMPPLKASRVRRVSRRIAYKVISRYEWLGTLPPGTDYFGLFFDDRCAGVACWSVGSIGAAFTIQQTFGVGPRGMAYLYRGANVHWAPKGSAPRLINKSLLELSRSRPEVEVSIAFADTDAGEIGTVYQAAGWTCVGRGVKSWQWVTSEGATRDRSMTREVMRRNRCSASDADALLESHGWRKQPINPKWRYVKVTRAGSRNPALLAYIEAHRVPYPKRGE